MALNNFRNKPEKPEEDESYSRYCSVENCQNVWAVRADGDKQKCSYHQWLNTGKPKKAPIFSNFPKKEKTVSAWYDEVKF